MDFQDDQAIPLTKASLSLLQDEHDEELFDRVNPFVLPQLMSPPAGGFEGTKLMPDHPPTLSLQSPILLDDVAKFSYSHYAAQPSSTEKVPESQRHRQGDGLTPALAVGSKCTEMGIPEKRHHPDSSVISPINGRSEHDRAGDRSETSFITWSTSPVRKAAQSPNPSAGKKVYEKRQRHKMRELGKSPKKSRGNKRRRREIDAKADKRAKNVPKTAFGALASSTVDSENLSGCRLTVKPPTSSTGIFHKGKASTPKFRTALPDLTFCEMDFLRQKLKIPALSGKDDQGNALSSGANFSSIFNKGSHSASLSKENINPCEIEQDSVNPAKPKNHNQPSIRIGKHKIPLSRTTPESATSKSGIGGNCRVKTALHKDPVLRGSSQSAQDTHLLASSIQSQFGSLSVNTSEELNCLSQRSATPENDHLVLNWLRVTAKLQKEGVLCNPHDPQLGNSLFEAIKSESDNNLYNFRESQMSPQRTLHTEGLTDGTIRGGGQHNNPIGSLTALGGMSSDLLSYQSEGALCGPNVAFGPPQSFNLRNYIPIDKEAFRAAGQNPDGNSRWDLDRRGEIIPMLQNPNPSNEMSPEIYQSEPWMDSVNGDLNSDCPASNGHVRLFQPQFLPEEKYTAPDDFSSSFFRDLEAGMTEDDYISLSFQNQGDSSFFNKGLKRKHVDSLHLDDTFDERERYPNGVKSYGSHFVHINEGVEVMDHGDSEFLCTIQGAEATNSEFRCTEVSNLGHQPSADLKHFWRPHRLY